MAYNSCYIHPKEESKFVCESCHKPICEKCLKIVSTQLAFSTFSRITVKIEKICFLCFVNRIKSGIRRILGLLLSLILIGTLFTIVFWNSLSENMQIFTITLISVSSLASLFFFYKYYQNSQKPSSIEAVRTYFDDQKNKKLDKIEISNM